MLGACNTCARLQSRVTGSDATVDGFLFVCSFLLLYLLLLLLLLFFLVFWGMGGEGRSINQKEYWGFEGELHIIISAGQRNWEVFCIGWGGGAQRCNCKLQVLEK